MKSTVQHRIEMLLRTNEIVMVENSKTTHSTFDLFFILELNGIDLSKVSIVRIDKSCDEFENYLKETYFDENNEATCRTFKVSDG